MRGNLEGDIVCTKKLYMHWDVHAVAAVELMMLPADEEEEDLLVLAWSRQAQCINYCLKLKHEADDGEMSPNCVNRIEASEGSYRRAQTDAHTQFMCD